MFSSKQFLFSTVVASALFTAPLMAQKITTDYDHSANFSVFHTYSFNKLQASDPLVEGRLRDALTRDLTAKGLQRVETGGDLSISAVGSRGTQQEYTSFYDGLGGGGFGWRRGWGAGGFGETTTSVEQIPVGSLVVDMYDGNSKHLVWRGMASDTLSNNPDKNTKKLDKAVDKMLAKLPVSGNAR